MRVLVTGGLGYIGSHVVANLAERGIDCDVIDNASAGTANVDFVAARCGSLWREEVQNVGNVIPRHRGYAAVIHLAALISVEVSAREPHRYWQNNLTALMALHHVRADHLIFASSGTAFNPTNPYARTKVAGEQYILDCAQAPNPPFGGHTIFRFYNVSGLRPGLRPTGQPTHLIRVAAEVARGLRPELTVFGGDYPTRDGTAVRDYIHVEDVAASIVNAVEVGPANTPFECLGTGVGSTVLEVVHAMERVTGRRLCVKMSSRRIGDDAITICPTRYRHINLSRTLEDMCLSAYENA